MDTLTWCGFYPFTLKLESNLDEILRFDWKETRARQGKDCFIVIFLLQSYGNISKML